MASYIKPDNGTYIIDSTSDLDLSNININDSALAVKGGQYVGGNLYVGGTLVANGDVITIGNTGGSLTLNANISSDVNPSVTNTHNIGSNTKQWDKIFVNKILLTANPTEETTSATLNSGVSYITSATDVALSLGDGEVGQVKTFIVKDVLTNPVTVTPNNPLGYTSFRFTNQGDSITIMWTSNGWAVISIFRTSIT